MACTSINSGITAQCEVSAGGVYSMFVASLPSGITSSADYLTQSSDGTITDFTGLTSSVPGWYQFTPSQNSSTFEQTFQASVENGSAGVEQKATFVFPYMAQEKKESIKQLMGGTVLVIVYDRNKKYWLLGEAAGARLMEGGASTGKVLTDLNGYTVGLVANEGDLANEVDSSAITVLG